MSKCNIQMSGHLGLGLLRKSELWNIAIFGKVRLLGFGLIQLLRREREFRSFNLIFWTKNKNFVLLISCFETRINFFQSCALRQEREYLFSISGFEATIEIETKSFWEWVFSYNTILLFYQMHLLYIQQRAKYPQQTNSPDTISVTTALSEAHVSLSFDCFSPCHKHTEGCHHGKTGWTNPPYLCVAEEVPEYWRGVSSCGCWVGWLGGLNLGHWVAEAEITDLGLVREATKQMRIGVEARIRVSLDSVHFFCNLLWTLLSGLRRRSVSIDSVTFCLQIAEVNGHHAEATLMQAYVCISAASACWPHSKTRTHLIYRVRGSEANWQKIHLWAIAFCWNSCKSWEMQDCT